MKRRSAGIAIGFAFALAGASGVAHAVVAIGNCSSLAGVTSDSATMTSATLVTPPATISGSAVTVPICRVQGVAAPTSDSEIKFEVWLPTTPGAWTGRMKVNGTGGYAGATPYPRLAQDVGDGFVSAGSNMGHDGGEAASWTLGHPEKVKDWGLRAHYYVATAAKALSQALYGQPVAHSYFEGCSNGGRQAMMMAQNYPELFDGIAAGAPSMFYPDLLMWLVWTGKQLTPVQGQPQSISAAKRNAITARALQACDANDGLVDGQITNPRMCKFDIDALGPSGDNTLTAAELNVVKEMYTGSHSSTGQLRYRGAKYGSEAAWDPNFADNGGYGPFIGHYVYSVLSPPYNWRNDLNWDDTIYNTVKQALTPITAAPSPDLRAFKNRGGKLIHYHGFSDSVVSPDGSINYLRSLAVFERFSTLTKEQWDKYIDALNPDSVSLIAETYGQKVRDYHRLFMMPSVGHCGGSTGPSSIGGGAPEPPAAFRDADHHVVSAVIKWVEQGVAPEKIIAGQYNGAGVPVRTRPLCAYPAQAAYNGSGDINVASNFSCVTPAVKDRPVEAADMVQIRNSLKQRELILPNR